MNYDIGNTPLELINFLSSPDKQIWAKFEYKNPTGSHKDRAYLSMIEDLEKKDEVEEGMTLVDYTSGNAGASLARLAQLKGYKTLVFVPSQMSADKIKQMESFGAEVRKVFSNAEYGYYGKEDVMRARLEAAKIAEESGKEYVFLDQGENPANKKAFEKLGRELIDDFETKQVVPDVFVASIGTGGTITGTSKALKERYGDDIKVVGVEPKESATIYAQIHDEEARHSEHNLSGVGIGAREANVDLSLIDDVVLVEQQEWIDMLHQANDQGYPIGKSSAADLVACKKVIEKYPEPQNVVGIFYDGIEKYESEDIIDLDSSQKDSADFKKIEENYKNSWDKLFQDDSFRLRSEKDPKLDSILSTLKNKSDARILSIACGDFVNEAYLCQKDLNIEGIDISKKALSKARSLIKEKDLENCSVKQADIFDNNFSDSSFDAIIMMDFSMHLTNSSLIDLFKEVSRLLKPDGLFFSNFLSAEDDTFGLGEFVAPKIKSAHDGDIIIRYRDLYEIEEIISSSPLLKGKTEEYERVDEPHQGFREEETGTHTHRGFFITAKNKLSSVSEAVNDIKQGEPIIIIDHREQEGDLFIPSEKITPDIVNEFLKYGRGVLCLSLLPERFQELDLGSPSTWGTGYNETRFGDPVDYLIGTTTGVSASDRAKTIKGMISESTSKSDIRVPGHVRTLEAMPGGLRERSGHTEASVELAKLAGFYPSGTVTEILNEDGTMAREPDLIELSEELNHKVVRINQLKHHIYGEI